MRKSRRIANLLSDNTAFGRNNEDRVEIALSTLQEEGQIVDYIRSEPHGELDRRGIDFLIYPESNWIIPLQVKSSFTGVKDHRSKHGPNIPCIVVEDCDEEELKEDVLRVLGLSVRGII
jgi:hypothetical protein